MMKNKRSSVLLFAMVIMGVVTLVTQQLIKSVAVGSYFSSSMIAREQAELLVLSGFEIAQAQLADVFLPKKNTNNRGRQPRNKTKNTPVPFIQKVLPHFGVWQEFALDHDYDGIDGTIKICFASEHGKLPLNDLYDPKKKDIKPPYKKLLGSFSQKKKLAGSQLVKQLALFFKKRDGRACDDFSELAPLANSLGIPLFYEPPAVQNKSKKRRDDTPSADLARPLALQDLFTTWSKASTLSPLLLSDSMRAVVGVRRVSAGKKAPQKKQYEQLASQFAKKIPSSVDELWKALQIIFTTKPKLSKEVMKLFSSGIEHRFFSVLSYAEVAGVKQRALAILEYVHKNNDQSSFAIRRVYWL